MKWFVFKGSHNTYYAVTLFQKKTCHCPSTSCCRHFLSAIMATDREPGPDKKHKLNIATEKAELEKKERGYEKGS